jgi:CPA1 family monovalent cation:H+ antiporter
MQREISCGSRERASRSGWRWDACTWIQRPLRDPLVEVLLSLTLPYVAYLVAEKIGASGVLAVVVAGLVRARSAPELLSAETRLITMTFWNAIVFLFNALIFIIIGMQLRPMIGMIEHHDVWQVLGYIAVLTGTAVIVRLIWVFPAQPSVAFSIAGGIPSEPPTWQEKLVVDGVACADLSHWSQRLHCRKHSPPALRFRSGTY